MKMVESLIALHNQKSYVEMESQAMASLEETPGDAMLWNLLGAAMHAQGKDPVGAFRKAVQFSPKNVDFQRNLAVTLFARGVYDEALDAYRAAAEIDPRSLQFLRGSGACLQKLGRHVEAVSWYDAAVREHPENPASWLDYGQCLFAMGEFQRAAESFERAVHIDRANVHSHILLANALRKIGQPDSAVEHYKAALNLHPVDAITCYSLGNALGALGRESDAAAAYRAALDIDPSHAEAANNLGVVYLNQSLIPEALDLFSLANRALPNSADITYNLGDALRRSGDAPGAVAIFERVIENNPRHHLALNNAALALTQMGQYAKALVFFENCLALKPDYVPAHINCALALHGLARFDDAIKSCSEAIAIDGSVQDSYSNRAKSLISLGRYAEALEDAKTALRLDESNVDALLQFAEVLYRMGRSSAASQAFERAMALAPEDPRPRFLAAAFFLRKGDYHRGFALYESRRHVPPHKYLNERIEGKLWTGQDSLSGKRILLYSEQGLGDNIQMLRYLPQLARMADSVLLRMRDSIMPLLESVPSNVTVVRRGDLDQADQTIDFVCPLFSLPFAMKTTFSTIPEARGCLSIPTRKHAKWINEFPDVQGLPRIGIAWSGNPGFPNDHLRSMPLAILYGAFAVPNGFEICALQKDIRPHDVTFMQSTSIRQFSEQMNDLADTAAILEHMDLVISVDTVVAHLAAALGKEVWLLLPFDSDWRWLSGTDRSPWYPSMRLYRQSTPNQWQDVLGLVSADLSKLRLQLM